jgi:hypothetical protein
VHRRAVFLTLLAGTAVATAVFGLACGSFAGEEPSSAGEAGAGESGSDGNTPDAGTSDSAPACIPQPLEASDAGEHASCGTSGLATDLASSTTNCGRCGHDCRESVCAAGRCTPKDFAVEGSPAWIGTATDSRLYWTRTTDVAQQFRSAGFDGTVAVTHGSIATDGGGPLTSALLNGADLFAILQSVGVVRAAATGSDTTVATFAPRANALTELAVDSDNVYALDYAGGIVATPRSGGMTRELLPATTSSQVPVRNLTSDGAVLYWTYTVPGGGPSTTVLKVRTKATGDVVDRASGLPEIRALTFDAEYIYMADTIGTVRRVAKAGSAAPEVIGRVPGTRLFPKGIAVDDVSIYVACTEDGALGTDQMTMFQISKCGGPARVIADDRIRTFSVVVAGDYLYWSRDSGIVRMAK